MYSLGSISWVVSKKIVRHFFIMSYLWFMYSLGSTNLGLSHKKTNLYPNPTAILDLQITYKVIKRLFSIWRKILSFRTYNWVMWLCWHSNSHEKHKPCPCWPCNENIPNLVPIGTVVSEKIEIWLQQGIGR